jgi:peptidyl-dipeptidase A
MNEQMQQFLDRIMPQFQELFTASSDAYWKATTTGSAEEEDRYSDLKAQMLKIFANREDFAELKRLKESGQVTEPLLARQLDMFYNSFAAQQIDPSDIEELVRRETEIESLFTAFRATIDGKKVSDNDISQILGEETDLAKRREAWEASKQVGAEVADKVLSLVRYRNDIAKKLGYPNYYVMSLELEELDEQELFSVLGELEKATNAPFAAMKKELDSELAARFGIQPSQMRPWHYSDPFFQETPTSAELDLNVYFEGKDVVKLSKDYYDTIGLDVQDLLDNSDLYEREGKNQHAYCIDINHEGDVRVLCNVRDNEYWMATMLHELGHAVYDKYNDRSLPWDLRQPAHILTTEAIAMLFGRLTRDAGWLKRIAGVSTEEIARVEGAISRQLTRSMLIFVRWGLVMTFFERDMYANPDQDLNALWWDYVERFQLIPRPENRNRPDWAAKIHLGASPVYYQNYILGELTASQLLAAMERDLGINNLLDEPRIGQWLQEKVFRPGAREHWNKMIEHATGAPLTPRYFVEQFVGK